MKKSLRRIINLLDRFNFDNIYLISENDMCNNMYIKYIQKYINKDKHKIIVLNNRTLNNINLKGNDVLILCGRWYLSRIAQNHGFNKLIRERFKITIPFDEIE
ncbi:hypothetical protein [Clostridium celatum]|uniref:hypothetical protein n=1 Tax=Clostridium celatum TaxID=36834 RepID=UPI002907C9CE|nr:hypothetical protein [Clostridium celatum]MDU6296828.1 hypothetical protein [Clostridium celatum]